MMRVFIIARSALLAWSASMPTGTGFAQAATTVTRSDHGSNHAEIIQSSPGEDAPAVEVEEGPGYVVIQQRSKNNSAVIIQQGREK